MSKYKMLLANPNQLGVKFLGLALGISVALVNTAQAADPVQKAEPAKTASSKRATDKHVAVIQTSLVPKTSSIALAPQVNVSAGKSMVLKLSMSAVRISVGNPDIADVLLLNQGEIYILGKKTGATNLIVWSKTGQTTVVDILVDMDTAGLQAKLQQLLPGEKNISVAAAADSLVLSGNVSDAVKVDRAMAIAEAYGAKKVVNLLRAAAPQQVMLEVKIAEVSKTLLDKLGVGFTSKSNSGGGGWTYSILTDFLTKNPPTAVIGVVKGSTRSLLLDAEKKDGLVKILAEPNIMAISGQKGSFLAGGKIFIPVARTNETTGGTTITLDEKEFGIGLVFTPTVLEGGRINLNLTPEVSEVLQTGSPFATVNNATAILPSFTVRRASTTVQLNDGQSFAIAGLIKNNVNETIKAFPVLGEIPILGALFRSSEFQNDRTELVFVVTPRLVKPLPPDYKLPTDDFVAPTRSEFFLEGKMEGAPKEPQSDEGAPTAAVKGAEPSQQEKPSGFEMK